MHGVIWNPVKLMTFPVPIGIAVWGDAADGADASWRWRESRLLGNISRRWGAMCPGWLIAGVSCVFKLTRFCLPRRRSDMPTPDFQLSPLRGHAF